MSTTPSPTDDSPPNTPSHEHVHSDACSHSHDSTVTGDSTDTDRPRRAILTKDDLERFLASDTCADYVRFITSLNDSVRNRTLRDSSFDVSPTVLALMGMLDTLDAWADEIPPDAESKSRFGNPGFLTWFDRLEANAERLVMPLLPESIDEKLFSNVVKASAGDDANPDQDKADSVTTTENPESLRRRYAVVEVATYLLHSFGNRKRIDYGTGHEAHFIAFLYCLEKLGVLGPSDHPALVLRVFWRYISVMRTLQFRYWLEPAGSHGVWGLDDYHFLPFMFGSSQLVGHRHLRPKSIHDHDIITEFSKDYMYLACVSFINSVKTSASLRWHSPMLDDISGVKTWDKVNQGMFKMYRAEVLGKLPIMQHFLFGSLIRFNGGSAFDPAVASEHHGHDHVHAFGQLRPDCCGMRIPSAIGASIQAKSQLRRPLPFD